MDILQCILQPRPVLGNLIFYFLDSFTRDISSTINLLDFLTHQQHPINKSKYVLCLTSPLDRYLTPSTNICQGKCGLSNDYPSVGSCLNFPRELYQSESGLDNINIMLNSLPFGELRSFPHQQKLRICFNDFVSIKTVLDNNQDKRYVFFFLSCKKEGQQDGHRLLIIFDQWKKEVYLFDPNGCYNFYQMGNDLSSREPNYVEITNRLLQDFICQFNHQIYEQYQYRGQINCNFFNHLEKARLDDLGKCIYICIFFAEFLTYHQDEDPLILLNKLSRINDLQSTSYLWYNYLSLIVERLIQNPKVTLSLFPYLSAGDVEELIYYLNQELQGNIIPRHIFSFLLEKLDYDHQEIDRISSLIG